MTDERQIIEEKIANLQAKQWRLERELAKKRIEYEKLEASSSVSPSSPFWERIFRKRLKRFMWEKEYRLGEKILELEQKIEQCTLELKEQLILLQKEKE